MTDEKEITPAEKIQRLVDSLASNKTHRGLKICADIISVVCIVYFIGAFQWAQYYPGSAHVFNDPLWVILAYCDILPFIFGMFWLLIRTQNFVDKHMSFLNTKWFAALFLSIVFFWPNIKHIIWR